MLNLQFLVERADKELSFQKVFDALIADKDKFDLFIKSVTLLGRYVGAFHGDSQREYYDEFMGILRENEGLKQVFNELCEDNYPYLFNGKRFFTDKINFPKAGDGPSTKRSKDNWTTKMGIAGNFATVMGNPEKGQEHKGESAPGTSGIVVFTQNVPKEKVLVDVDNTRDFLQYIIKNYKDNNEIKIKISPAVKSMGTMYGPYGEPSDATEEGEIITTPIDDIKVLLSYKISYDKENGKIDIDSDYIDLSVKDGKDQESPKEIIERAKHNAQRFVRGLETAKDFSFGKNKFINLDLTAKVIPATNQKFTKEQVKQIAEKYKNEINASIEKAKKEAEDSDIMNDPVKYGSDKNKRIKRFLQIIGDLDVVKNANSLDEFAKVLYDLKKGEPYAKKDFAQKVPQEIESALQTSFVEWLSQKAQNYENVDQAFNDFRKEIEEKYFKNIFNIFDAEKIKKYISHGYSFGYITQKFKKPEIKKPASSTDTNSDDWKRYLPSFRNKEWNKGKSDEELKPAILSWIAKSKK